MTRLRFLPVAALVAAGAFAVAPAYADPWPDKPVHLVVPYGPGSASDIVARLVAKELQGDLKATFVVDDKPGALGIIGTDFVAKAKPDGYTLLLTTILLSIDPHLFKSVPFHSDKDFTYIGLVCTLPYLLTVDAKLPVKTMDELAAYAKAGHKVSYAYSNGPGEIGGALLAKAWGVPMVGVPYKSSPPAMTDVMSGQVSLMWTDVSSSKPFIQSGSLRPLALAANARSRLLPDLPTVKEASGLDGFEMITWVGIAGPAGLPAPVVDKVNAAINAMLKRPDVVATLAGLGADVGGGSPHDFQAFEKAQFDAWGKRIVDAGIPPR